MSTVFTPKLSQTSLQVSRWARSLEMKSGLERRGAILGKVMVCESPLSIFLEAYAINLHIAVMNCANVDALSMGGGPPTFSLLLLLLPSTGVPGATLYNLVEDVRGGCCCDSLLLLRLLLCMAVAVGVENDDGIKVRGSVVGWRNPLAANGRRSSVVVVMTTTAAAAAPEDMDGRRMVAAFIILLIGCFVYYYTALCV